MSGVVVIESNAGSLTGAAIRGGDLVIKGQVGARTGIDQKGGTIIALGSAGSMTGFMMQRGRQIICGDAGPGLGDSMYDGTIYVGGKVKSLGVDCVEGEWTDADTEFDRAQVRASTTWARRRHCRSSCAARSSTTTTRSSHPSASSSSRRGCSMATADENAPMARNVLGHSSIFTPEVIDDIHVKSELGPLPDARLLDVQEDPALGRAHVHAGHADPVRDRGLPREVPDQDGAGRAVRVQADRARHPGLHHRHVASARCRWRPRWRWPRAPRWRAPRPAPARAA